MDVTEEIKARLDIVDVLSGYVPLKKAGRNYKALCPFHSEKTPSFVVFPESQRWRCFGACNEGGDIFTFVMKIEGWDFGEALRALAERAGVKLEPHGSAEKKEEYDRLRDLLAEATTYFHHLLLNAPAAAVARDYVKRRGLSNETLRAFMLGYAPNSWDATSKHLQSQGYTEPEMVAAGLMVEREDGRRYDRFRHRLVIPIRDERGRTAGFGARALDPDDTPKYLNSPQNPLFDKGRLLFGMDRARRAIRERETAVLVEGYMDVMQAHQAGYGHIVAQMGTALTEAQLRQLSKYARRLILALDPDAAGVRATLRDLEVARTTLEGEAAASFDARGMIRWGGQLDLDIRILRLPPGMDPDDLIRERPDEWQRRLDEAMPVAEYVIAQATQGQDLSNALERERIARALLPILAATESQLQSQANLQALARALRFPEETMLAWARAQARGTRGRETPRRRELSAPAEAAPSVPRLAANRQERYCLKLLIQEPSLIYRIDRRLQELGEDDGERPYRLSPEDFSQPSLREIFRVFRASLTQDAQESLDYMRAALPEALVSELDALLENEPPGDLMDPRVVEEALNRMLSLRERSLQRQIQELRLMQAELLEDGDLTRVEEVGTIVSQRVRELRRLQKALPYDRSAVSL